MFAAFFADCGVGAPGLRLDVPALWARDRDRILFWWRHWMCRWLPTESEALRNAGVSPRHENFIPRHWWSTHAFGEEHPRWSLPRQRGVKQPRATLCDEESLKDLVPWLEPVLRPARLLAPEESWERPCGVDLGLPTKVTPSSITSLAARTSPNNSVLAFSSILSFAMTFPVIFPRTTTEPISMVPLILALSPRFIIPSELISPSTLPSNVNSPANLKVLHFHVGVQDVFGVRIRCCAHR